MASKKKEAVRAITGGGFWVEMANLMRNARPYAVAGILALAALSVLATLVAKSGLPAWLLALVVVAILVLTVAVVFAILAKTSVQAPGAKSFDNPTHSSPPKNTESNVSYEWDMFVSSPMDSIEDNERAEMNRAVGQLCNLLRTRWKLKVYCAGDHLASAVDRQKFESPDQALSATLGHIRKSRSFLLVMPTGVPSSSLVEAGLALALNLPCVLVCNHPPYLLRAQLLKQFKSVEELRQSIENDSADYWRTYLRLL